MRVVFFVHSLLSDWNHGNAHFLRGVVSELISRGYDVVLYEPRDAWSLQYLRDIPEHERRALGERARRLAGGLISQGLLLTL